MQNPTALSLITSTEKEILKLIQSGLISNQIADSRGCSARTVEKHRSNIIKKLHLKPTNNALLLWCIETKIK